MLNRFILPILAVSSLLAGCARYTVPGGAADLTKLGVTPEARAAMTDQSVQAILAKKPLVTFPAAIALARVQARDYDSYTYHSYRVPQSGAYSLITVRDIEKETDLEELARLPQVSGVVPLKRIVVSQNLSSDEELRQAAARLHAGLLLYYTFDTRFETDEHIKPLGVITLGLAPNQIAKVTCTASAVLMDVNNGYLYAVVEATAKEDQLTNAWESSQAMDEARRRAERKAFENMLREFTSEWKVVLATYNRPAITTGVHE